ncbi:MAG TPA: DUF4982 domain-containing protein [Epulopiscium sp.]|nr:DUF4982 domain-containing protein [Candidatus Epulonipiscium sp.]
MYEKNLFNYFWSFAKHPIDATYSEVVADLNKFKPVTLPHDWLIYDTENLYETSSGWYRKTFQMNALEDLMSICFEGVYMDSTIYMNGKIVGEWKYGYTTFEIDISKAIVKGENEIVVQVRHESPNSRWYSGAGIYRDVWLIKRGQNHIKPYGIYVSTAKKEYIWQMDIETNVNATGEIGIRHTLSENQDPIVSHTKQIYPKDHEQTIKQTMAIEFPKLWSVNCPNLYDLTTELIQDNIIIEKHVQKVGFKEIVLDSEKGFFLNGQSMKLNGVCEHHDLGCLGAAFNKTAMRRRLEILKGMGVNAIRTAHNMPSPGFMELTDEMGFLVVSEAFDMWERSKTTFDYARFFKEWVKKDIEQWVKRDRNHVSLIMWSIGNEIYDTHIDKRGQTITQTLMDLVKSFDPKENAVVTIGSNYMPWENAKICADIVKVVGYNYAEKYYKAHHKEHADWVIYGSETSSIVQSRGIYHFPYDRSILADDDLQCSSLGNSSTSWGAKSIEDCITFDRDQKFSLGQFIWTGFDYIGEPTPYHTRNSYFGQIDTAGFPKDSYYVYKSAWTNYKEDPMIHIFPYWDFNEGQIIDVRVCTNAPYMKLFLNTELIGEAYINHKKDKDIIKTWKIPFIEGELTAEAYDVTGNIVATHIRKSFGDPVKLKIKANKNILLANGTDLLYLTISALDKEDNPVENANNRINIKIAGQGNLLGIDNGDSTDQNQYKGSTKRLFSGKCSAVIGATLEPGKIIVEVSAKDMEPVSITFTSKEIDLVGEAKQQLLSGNLSYPSQILEVTKDTYADLVPIRKIQLMADSGQVLNKECTKIHVKAITRPYNATYEDLSWRVVNDVGIDSNIGKIKVDKNGCEVTAIGDGEFRLRCMATNGKGHPDIISELEFKAEDLGKAYKNPYSFISGGLYDYSQGEVTSGNERGVATSRDGKTVVGFKDLDFGEFGSDQLTIPIFALTDEPYEIEIWEGIPETEEGICLNKVIYQKESKWNVYQEETYKLSKRLKGITCLTFILTKKIHIKGFSFQKLAKAYEKLYVSHCDEIYGDSFTPQEWGIGDIGNNVTIIFKEMDFNITNPKSLMEFNRASQITICGRAINESSSIRIQVKTNKESFNKILEFKHSEDFQSKVFDIDSIEGRGDVEFIFLPGSNFDFKWFKFS